MPLSLASNPKPFSLIRRFTFYPPFTRRNHRTYHLPRAHQCLGFQYSKSNKRPFCAVPCLQVEEPTTRQEVSGQSAGNAMLSRLSRSIGQLETPKRTGSAFVSNEYHLYIYAHRHNTHITLSEPQHEDTNKIGRRRQKMLLSLSSGNLGFRKSQRGSYDAAYQLGAYFMSRMQNDGLLARIHRLELVLRGFGQGREAVTKILLGMEGANIRDRIVRVVDASRVKMGGQRAPKPRRLG